MTTRPALVLIQPVAVLGLVVAAFAAFNKDFRQLEGVAATAALHLIGAAPDAVQARSQSGIAVFPDGLSPFVAIITPSCSALSSLLAIAALGAFTPGRRAVGWIAAVGCALVCVFVGNVLRIAGSVGIGLLYGSRSLVLFHDWIGSLFAFGYTLGGFLLMVYLLLPPDRPAAGHPNRRRAFGGPVVRTAPATQVATATPSRGVPHVVS